MDELYRIDRDSLWPTTGGLPHPLGPDRLSTRVWKHLNTGSLCRLIGSLLSQPPTPSRALAVQVIIEVREMAASITLVTLGYSDTCVPASARSHHEFTDFLSRLMRQAQGKRLQCVFYCHPYGVFWLKETPRVD